MKHLGQDFRFAVRLLVKNPGFSAVAIVTLALGIGVNSAIFSVTDQLLLRPLPVEDPDRLIALRSPGPQWGNIMSDGDNAASFSHPVYRALAQRGGQTAELMARFAIPLSVSVQGLAERAAGELVSGNYFQVLRVEPAAGRLFTPQDDEVAGGHPLAVLAHGYWKRRFEGDPSIVGSTILINGHLMSVIGVAQPGFTGVQTGRLTDVFIPVRMKARMTPNWDGLDDWQDYWLTVLGRLRPGVSRQAAATALTAPYQAVLQEQVRLTGSPSDDETRRRFLSKPIQVLSASSGRPPGDDVSAPLAAVFGMVGLVLLIACTNVANLLIAQGVSRRHEISVRLALGGSRIRLLRQLLVESLVLAVPGAAVGLLLAMWTSQALFAEMTSRMGLQGFSAQLSWRMLGFSLAIALMAAVLSGLLPAIRSTRPNLLASLKGMPGSAGKRSMRLRQALVVSQIAVTMTLLVTAGLLARSFYNITRTSLGLNPQHVLQFSVDPELNGYTAAQTLDLAERLAQSLAGLPGVQASGSARIPVMAQVGSQSNVTIEGYQFGPQERDYVGKNWIGPRFFSTLGLTLLAGRSFNHQDTAEGLRVAVINQTMANLYFRGRSAVGSRFGFGKGGPERLTIEIVGVVQDSKYSSARDQPEPFVYMPLSQLSGLGKVTLYLRTVGDPQLLADRVRRQVQQLDPNLPVYDLKTFEAQIAETNTPERILMVLSGSFAILATVLAAIGLSGVMAYGVARRSREIGIRLALGALPRSMRWLVLREAGAMTVLGLAFGLPAAYALGRLAESMLYEVQAGDPSILSGAALLMAAFAFLSGYWPARRAAGVDPVTAIRYE